MAILFFLSSEAMMAQSGSWSDANYQNPNWGKNYSSNNNLDVNNETDFAKFASMVNEEMTNTALSLCHYTDKMMMSYERYLEKEFTENGGIRERMTAARLGYRNIQKATIEAKDREIARLKQEIEQLRTRVKELEEKYLSRGD